MKRVVADTNVLVSALQFGGKPKQLLDLATASIFGCGGVQPPVLAALERGGMNPPVW